MTKAHGAALTIVTMVFVGLGPLGSAHAGTYPMRNCNVPGHANNSVGPWTGTLSRSELVWSDECDVGGGFGIAVPSHVMPDDSFATIVLDAPNGSRRSIELQSVQLWAVQRLTSRGWPVYVGAYSVGETEVSLSSIPFMPSLATPEGSGGAAALPNGTRGLRVTIVCAGAPNNYRAATSTSTTDDCLLDDAIPLEIRGSVVTLAENVLPTGSVVGGTLVGGVPVSGPSTLNYSAADRESGLLRVEAIVGEDIVATRDLAGSCTYADFTACPTTDAHDLTVDTTRLSDGRHPLSLRVWDAAGNHYIAQVTTVEVRNHGPGGIVAGANMKLTARFAKTPLASLTASYGRRVRIDGRLSGPPVTAIGNARVEAFERVQGSGARQVAIGSATTKPDGTFSYELPRGPSRTVLFKYRPSGSDTVASTTLKLKVRAASGLRVSLHGTRLRYSGEVLSRPIPKRGKRVTLQGRAPGYAWSTLATLRTDRRGMFRGTYRLSVRRPGIKLQFRVTVPTERSYPYLTHRGPPVSAGVG
jgi:hypothetical protein